MSQIYIFIVPYILSHIYTYARIHWDRNAMWRTRISESSSTVSMWARRGPLLWRKIRWIVILVFDTFFFLATPVFGVHVGIIRIYLSVLVWFVLVVVAVTLDLFVFSIFGYRRHILLWYTSYLILCQSGKTVLEMISYWSWTVLNSFG